MSYEVTATRKRPQTFDQLKGQEFVVSTIQSAIDNNKIAHAYLFSGPRGTGKTTSARLLAKALNCEKGPTSKPCGVCSKCKEITMGVSTDVIEIDGASNTSVNDIRTIKEEVLFPPSNSRYKIYIIDEVHMLSINAFNALLKTIEEPPEYIIFIFATTETHKVPATIKSRCQQFNFQLFDVNTIKELLTSVCKEKKIKYEDNALIWISKEATGSMRDAYTLFDQVVSFSNNDITLEKIEKTLGIVEQQVVQDLVNFMADGDRKNALTLVNSLLTKGTSITNIIKSLASYFKSLILLSSNIVDEQLLYGQSSNYPLEIRKKLDIHKTQAALTLLLDLYRNIRYSINPKIELELCVSKLCSISSFVSTSSLLEEIKNTKKTIKLDKDEIPVVKKEEVVKSKTLDDKELKNFINQMPQMLMSTLNKSNIKLSETSLIIEVATRYHYNLIEKQLDNIKGKLKSIYSFNKPVNLVLVEEKEKVTENLNNNDPILNSLLKTFDGKIVEE